ncbi:hypothetical protein PM082_007050 [Marasmius tenuissimus]|nr:hypothetical protein PM082_007050 [Marasmius tenuissimus]
MDTRLKRYSNGVGDGSDIATQIVHQLSTPAAYLSTRNISVIRTLHEEHHVLHSNPTTLASPTLCEHLPDLPSHRIAVLNIVALLHDTQGWTLHVSLATRGGHWR